MITKDLPGDDALSPAQLIEINRICDGFEAALRSGHRPRIEDHLGDMTEPVRSALLRELLTVEREYRRSAGEAPRVAEYRARFPGHEHVVEAALARASHDPSRSRSAADPDSDRVAADAGRNLLYGLLALQNGFIDRGALLGAFTSWVTDKSKSLGAILLGQGALDGPRNALLEALVGEHLKLHGGDPERSLAALAVGDSTRKTLESVGDAGLEVSLSYAGVSEPGYRDAATALYAVDTSSADGRRFRVLRPHAQGGLGAVFVALDSELNREVALKQILEHHADDQMNRARFLMEAEITGRLEHPGIVPVYGLGTYQDGRPYYAMRFIRGDSLKDAIGSFHADEALKSDAGRRSLELRRLLRRFLDVCNAIDYAHSRGVLHRDVKPGNVIVGKYGETLVVDWGLAKPIGRQESLAPSDERTLWPSPGSGSAETLPGSALGTPAYMSPEQAAGELDRLGPRSDVYSLGATLYCLLTGRPPFTGSDVDAVLGLVSRGSFPPPRRLDPTLDRALEAICLKAMALRPEKRYATPRELADDVEHWLADEPVSARREPLINRARRWSRRHRTLVTTAAAVVLLGLISLSAFAAVVSDKNRKLVAANQATKKAETLADARLDRAMTSIEDYFTGFSEDALKGGQLPAALRDRLLAKPRQFYEQLAAELAAKPNPSEKERALLAKGRRSLGQILQTLGKSSEARTQLEAAIAMYEALIASRPNSPALQHGLAMCQTFLARALSDLGKSAEAAGPYRKAVALYEVLTAQYPDEHAYQVGLTGNHDNLAIALAKVGRNDEAVTEYQASIRLLEALLKSQPDVSDYQEELARSLSNVGILLNASGRADEAGAAYKKSIEIYETLVARQPEDTKRLSGLAGVYHNLGGVFDIAGRSEDAGATFQKAVNSFEALVAREPNVLDHKNRLAASYNNLAATLTRRNQHGKAVAAFQQAAALYQNLVDREPTVLGHHYGLGCSHLNLGGALISSGKPDEAAESSRKAVATFQALTAREPAVPQYQFALVASLTGRGELFDSTGRVEEAVATFQNAATICERLVARQPNVPGYLDARSTSLSNLGEALVKAKRLEEAADAYAKAVTTSEALIARYPNVPDYKQGLATVHANVGVMRKSQGQVNEALAAFRLAAKFVQPGTPVATALPDLIRDADAAVVLANRLPAVLKGDDKPKDGPEGRGLAQLCHERMLYTAAAQLWAGALAADPKLAEDREAQLRYTAACSAALAAAGKGKDEPALDDAAKAKLREQARDWLKAELAAWSKLFDTGPPKARPAIQQALAHWKGDTDLVGIRDETELAKLPESEREVSRKLWADVDDLLKKLGGNPP